MERHIAFTDWKTQHNKSNSSQIDIGNSIIQERFFVDIEKTILNFKLKCKGYRIAKIILKKNLVGGIIHSNFKL